MAETLVFNMVEKLIARLASYAVQSWNLKDDLEKLKTTMLTIKAVLLDAEKQQRTNREVKHWLDRLKDALHDAEDLLDDFSTEALRQEVMTRGNKAKKVRIFFSSSNQLVFSFKMMSKTRETRERLDALDVERRNFSFTNLIPEQQVETQRQTHSFIRQEDIIGRDEEKDVLTEFLLNVDLEENVSIFSIIGIGGLGKTALAQLVYNDKAVQGHFELTMWVCVSDDFDVKLVAQKMLGSKNNEEMDQVQQALRKKIQGKRYLLVLDDIWNENRELWLKLMTLLMEGGKGSKIVITTRSEKVSKITGTSSPFFLRGLNEEQSWKLFTQLAFENGKEPENQNLTAIGKDIVRTCAGVPLAIRSIGSLMCFKESEKDWLNFKDKDLVKIDENGDTIFQLIKLSYDHLPFYLKQCFAFCSLFPKDYEIYIETLIRFWVAQGYLQSSDESASVEDVGNEYFMDLAQRSFFQSLRRDILGNIKSCQMHDIVHDLATFVSGRDFLIVNEKRQHIDERTRHLSFGFPSNSSWQVPSSFVKGNKLRTFLGLCGEKSLQESACSSIMSSLEQLRVLDLNRSNLMTLPTCIGTLKHLRYLDFSYHRQLEVLPGSITKLQNLQTLLLNGCSKLRELPRNIWKLTNLRHLELYYCDKLTCMPHRIGQLTNLQTLSPFVLDSGGASELGGLNNLRGGLTIKGLESLRHNRMQAKALNLMEKSHLEWLELRWDGEINADQDNEVAKDDDILLRELQPHYNIKILEIEGFCGLSISSWISSFTNLIRIFIKDCPRLQNLSPLHLLPHLERLSLINLPCLEWIDKDGSDDNSSTFYPSLEYLVLQELPNLRGWWRCSEEGMAGDHCPQQPLLFESLHNLVIDNCPNQISMPLHPYVYWARLHKVSEKTLWQVVKLPAMPIPLPSTMQELDIYGINDLKSLSGVLQHLTALQTLWIQNCEELEPCNDEDGNYGMEWKELKNLQTLYLYNIPKMVSLPEGLQNCTTLKMLTIKDCVKLAYLPEWIDAVQHVKIVRCPKLMSLHEGLQNLNVRR